MDLLRTPDARFEGLYGYPFAPHYFDWEGLRVHYVDEGRGTPVLMLHGEPTWSYMYRKVIAGVAAAGYRAIAPDFVGFGRSDKVVDDGWYVIERHVETVRALIDALDLREITLVVHDWGGPIGLRQAVDMPDRFARLVILNTWLHHEDFEYTEPIRRWREYALGFPPPAGDLPAGNLLSRQPNVLDDLRPRLWQAYEAPFPDARYKAGPRRFPWCLPFVEPEAGNAADQQRCFDALKSWTKPVHFLFGDRDVIFTVDWQKTWSALVPGTRTVETVPGPHFVLEESGDIIAEKVVGYLKS